MPRRQEFRVPHSKDQTFNAVLQALPTVKGMKVKSSEPATGHIEASTGMSLRSWGEKVRIDVVEEGDGSVVQLSSGNKAQLTSWGKNDENLRNIETAVRRSLGSTY